MISNKAYNNSIDELLYAFSFGVDMSGYAGPDDESLHALILAENGIHACQQALKGNVQTHCLECGEEIDPRRVAFARKHNIKCELCINCQEIEDRKPKPRIKMLDWIL